MSVFKKAKAKTDETAVVSSPTRDAPRYNHPKILAVDLNDEDADAILAAGYNVSTGTFGRPYKVPKGSGYHPVIIAASLPNYTEQEIIVADLAAPEQVDAPVGEKSAPQAELDWWAKGSKGVVDPRPRTMAMVDDVFERILQRGGCFVLFADSRVTQNLVYAAYYNQYQGITIDRELHYDNWSLLPTLTDLAINSDHGYEITVADKGSTLSKLLADHLEGASFTCTLQPNYRLRDRWIDLAKNKYGETVAGIIAPPEKSKAGCIFILPRLNKKGEFVAALLKNILPDLFPTLFPEAEGQKWVHRVEYELPSVLRRSAEISQIQDEAAARVAELEKAIQSDRDENSWLYDLLRETGTPLVESVKRALSTLGFTKVVDVDEEMSKAGKDSSLREDLRIHDTSPTLVVDIKGVAGHPADAEALQAQKHAFIYIQEQGRADVRALTIMNHQRLLPPLDRENTMPFRQEILDNAAQVSLGLLTTWDLFRLVRGLQAHGWRTEAVRPLFYRTGRIESVPLHYEYIGPVTHVWKNAFSVAIESARIARNDQIAVELPVDFYEQPVTSLRLDSNDVAEAGIGMVVGIALQPDAPKIKEGYRVFRVINQTDA